MLIELAHGRCRGQTAVNWPENVMHEEVSIEYGHRRVTVTGPRTAHCR